MLVEVSFDLKNDTDGAIKNLITDACLVAGFYRNHFDDQQLRIDISTDDKSAATNQIYNKFLQIAQSVANRHNIVIHIASMLILVDFVARAVKPHEKIDYGYSAFHKDITIMPIS